MGVLRVLLAISVILTHTESIFRVRFVGGPIAVEAFYIISGFYMSLILNEKYICQNNSYKLYISNRLLRLYPVYWTVALMIVAYSLIQYFALGKETEAIGQFIHYGKDLHPLSRLYLVLTNLLLVGQDLAMFMGLDPASGSLYLTSDFKTSHPMVFTFLLVPQAWTIGVEILFYLIAPFLVRRNLKVISFVILLSIVLRFYLINTGLDHDPWTYRFFPTELLFFMLGVIAYRIYKRIEDLPVKVSYLKYITIFMVLFTIVFNGLPVPFKTPLYFVLFTIALPFIFRYTKNIKWDNKIGELSYPIYISHLFIFSIVEHWQITTFLGSGIMVTICSILFATLLVKFVVEPIEKIRQRRLYKAKPVAA